MIFGVIIEYLGLPELASEHGEMVDNMNDLVHVFMAVLGFGWSIFLGIAIWKFHHTRHPKADYHGVRGHASTHVEVGVILVEAILLLGFAFPLWGKRVKSAPTGPDVVKVRAVGQMYSWTMHYAGEDGVFGRTHPGLISGLNPVGRDMDDPNGRDDFLSAGEMVLPVGRACIIDVSSKDVIHNLHLVPMRVAQDAIPGTEAQMWFRPIKTGEWEILCGQLCGEGHASMKGFLTVQASDAFDEWEASESAAGAATWDSEKAARVAEEEEAAAELAAR